MPKRPGIVALNPASEAFARYYELMPAVTDVRGEEVAFDLGSYAHFTRREGREQYVVWIRETLENPDEIRRDFDRRHPERELYLRRLRSDEVADEETFIVWLPVGSACISGQLSQPKRGTCPKWSEGNCYGAPKTARYCLFR